ncbi:FAD-dependent oxidoreductase, partial [Crossiella equi]
MAVLVVGAGPTGLVLACALLSRGVPVRLVDRASAPLRTTRALGLHVTGVEVLDRLGALADLPQRGTSVGTLRINSGGIERARLPVHRSVPGSRHQT